MKTFLVEQGRTTFISKDVSANRRGQTIILEDAPINKRDWAIILEDTPAAQNNEKIFFPLLTHMFFVIIIAAHNEPYTMTYSF